jgi:hypothetical protein
MTMLHGFYAVLSNNHPQIIHLPLVIQSNVKAGTAEKGLCRCIYGSKSVDLNIGN